MAKRKSFFQILTGASNNEEEKKEDEAQEDFEQEPELTVHLKEEPKIIETQPEPAPEPAQPEEPEEQAEGQLTLDLYQTPTEFVIKTPVAGVKESDLEVEITSDTVKIRGKRIQEEEVPKENYFHQELYWGAFSRSVMLPSEIDEDRAEATLSNGILTIRLPKLRKEQVKKLKIKTS